MPNLRNLTISKKLWLLSALTGLGLISATAFALNEYYDDLLLEKEYKAGSLVEAAMSVIAEHQTKVELGELSVEDAKEKAAALIKALRYDDGNYFWINDLNARIVMHPIKPQLDGKDLSNFKDPGGKRIFAEFAAVAKRDGEGIVPYLWPKPGSEKPVKKISFVKGFKPWGWVVGTGLYVDDVESALWENAVHMGLASLTILLVQTVLSVAITRSIVTPIRKTTDAMDDISMGEGDLTRRLDEQGKDEIALLSSAFNRYNEKIHQIVVRVSQGSTQLSAAATELSATMSQTYTDIAQQQVETQQVATAVTEMAATVEEVACSANGAADSARTADEQAKKGKDVVLSVTDSINGLAEEMESASIVINSLADESENIGSVLDVIRDIAEQTNLLALNAAIEAARAGEQGRGFAVVADEVRTLASRTQKATMEIRDMIERLQSGSQNAVAVIQRSGEALASTVAKAQEAKDSLEHIVLSVTSISDRNLQIASASEEQSTVAREIDKSVVQISQLAEHSAQATEQVTQATNELSVLSEGLQEMISSFKTA